MYCKFTYGMVQPCLGIVVGKFQGSFMDLETDELIYVNRGLTGMKSSLVFTINSESFLMFAAVSSWFYSFFSLNIIIYIKTFIASDNSNKLVLLKAFQTPFAERCG